MATLPGHPPLGRKGTALVSRISVRHRLVSLLGVLIAAVTISGGAPAQATSLFTRDPTSFGGVDLINRLLHAVVLPNVPGWRGTRR